ncbi:MAG: hypothetical protein B6U94_03435 [Thermofilum sp. ex4484_79]|nr:MAG: hypothetical protein B6U94_03435 [Thermofilum sp. ex4484_79]
MILNPCISFSEPKMISAFTSLSKGGTGKSTLASVITLSLGLADTRVLLIDFGEEGSSSRIMLRNPSPPYLRNILEGTYTLIDAIGLYSLSVFFKKKSLKSEFYMIPNIGSLPILNSNFNYLIVELAKLQDYLDFILIDYPAFQDYAFLTAVNSSDKIILVTEPNSAKAVVSLAKKNLKGEVIPVLNKYVKASSFSKTAYDVIISEYGECFVVPFDPALALINYRTLPYVLGNIKKETQNALINLIARISE